MVDHPLFSKLQVNVLIWMPRLSASISLIASSLIIYMCTKRKRNKWNTYHRLLFAMSIIDVISSINLALSGIMLPAKNNDDDDDDTSSSNIPVFVYDYPTYGNTGTCTVHGFLAQLIVSVALYNLSLCFYFKLVIVNQWTDRKIRNSYIEFVMHIISIGYPILFGIIGIYYNAFNPLLSMPGWCYLIEAPFGCSKNNTCIRGLHARKIKKYAFIVPVTFAIVGIVLCMIQIYYTVRKQERRMIIRYSFAHRAAAAAAAATAAAQQQQQSSLSMNNTSTTAVLNYDVNSNNNNDNTFSIRTPSLSSSMNYNNSGNTNNRYSNNNNNNVHCTRTKQTLEQANLYTITFLISFLTPFVKIFVGTNKDYTSNHVKIVIFLSGLLQTTLLPLQGLWNLIIYTRPTRIQYKKRHPNDGQFIALWATLNGKETQHDSNRRHRQYQQHSSRHLSLPSFPSISFSSPHVTTAPATPSSSSTSFSLSSSPTRMLRRPAIYIPSLHHQQQQQQTTNSAVGELQQEQGQQHDNNTSSLFRIEEDLSLDSKKEIGEQNNEEQDDISYNNNSENTGRNSTDDSSSSIQPFNDNLNVDDDRVEYGLDDCDAVDSDTNDALEVFSVQGIVHTDSIESSCPVPQQHPDA